MKTKLIILETGTPKGWVTVGTWYFTEAYNEGALVIEVSRLSDRRYMWAVVGHEWIEAMYCKMFNHTTAVCDAFDIFMEEEYAAGRKPLSEEQGFDKRCPYRRGHIMGAWWEWFVIHTTFASWKKYDADCNRIMGITEA